MTVIDFPDQVSRILARADFRGLSANASVQVAQDLSTSFVVTEAGAILLHPDCAADAFNSAVAVRQALELLLLRRLWPAFPALAALAAARTAALFAMGERPGVPLAAPQPHLATPDYKLLTADAPPLPQHLRPLWASLACHHRGADVELPPAPSGLLDRIWPVLGPAEWLMQSCGNRRLRLVSDRLNGYGGDARPGTSKVSFASATGCSISERGYNGAETMRQAMLAEIVDNAAAVNNALATVRGVIRTAWGLPPGTFVALAPSSAEAELFALAATQGAPDERPVTAVLMDPAEIDDGVAIAALGRHPAAVTGRGTAVKPFATISGYRGDTEVQSIALRDGNGKARAAEDVAAECVEIATEAIVAGRRVVLHRLDTSRTGLLAPNTSALVALQESHPDQVDVVVDASQARLSPDRVWEYLALGWIVVLSGSKFLTGPQSAAAVLVPETLRDRFARKLPDGLRDYSGRAEWPPSLAAATQLLAGGDVGLALRWAAALAEMHAFTAISPAEQQRIVSEFCGSVRLAVACNADLLPLDTRPPCRTGFRGVPDEFAWNGAVGDGAGWDETETVISFAMRDPGGSGWLSPAATQQVHDWLEADLGALLPIDATSAQQAVARRTFQVGQPVTIAIGGDVGVLSIAASTRLVSAVSSHAASNLDERLARATLDVQTLLAKVSLVLRHWPLLDGHASSEAPS